MLFSTLSAQLPAGFVPLDALAFAIFVLSWGFYHYLVEVSPLAARSLNARMNNHRLHWMRQMAGRENRIFDAQIMASLQNGTAFFASTALVAIGGALALLQGSEQILKLFAELPFAGVPSQGVWEVKVIGLAVIFNYSFFKFGWSYRLFNYAAILLGGVPQIRRDEPPGGTLLALAEQTGAMLVVAGQHFNRGQRAFFFALAYLGWFLGSGVFILTTLAALAVMAHRQFSSKAAGVMALTIER